MAGSVGDDNDAAVVVAVGNTSRRSGMFVPLLLLSLLLRCIKGRSVVPTTLVNDDNDDDMRFGCSPLSLSLLVHSSGPRYHIESVFVISVRLSLSHKVSLYKLLLCGLFS